MLIGIIDSGVDPSQILNYDIVEGTRISINDKGEIWYDDSWTDLYGHGSLCFQTIINEICNVQYGYETPDVQFVIVAVIGEDGVGDHRLIVPAIQWCLKQGVSIINISLGTLEYSIEKEILNTCQVCYDKNVVVVAATNNSGKSSLPASITNVVRCKVAVDCGNNEVYYDTSTDSFSLQVLPLQVEIQNGTKVVHSRPKNSLAASRLTGIIAKILIQNKVFTPLDLKNELINRAICFDNRNRKKKMVQEKKIKASPRRLCVTPIDREISLLLRYYNLSQYPIVAAVDPIRINLWDKPIPSLHRELESVTVYRTFGEVVSSQIDFDTFLVGNLYENSMDELKDIAEKNKRCIWSLRDDEVRSSYESSVNSNIDEISKQLPVQSIRNDLPTLLILSLRKGLQPLESHLALMNALLAEEYVVEGLSTVALGELFGFFTPQGINEIVSGKEADKIAIATVNIMKKIVEEKAESDILISSSHFPLFVENSIYTISFNSLAFLNAVRPNAVLIHCSYIDSFQYIREVIDLLYSATGVMVIGIAIADSTEGLNIPSGSSLPRKISPTKLNSKAIQLSQQVARPVISLSEESAGDKLMTIVEGYFAGSVTM